MKVKELLGKLKPLVEKLEQLLHKLRQGPLKKVVEKMNGLRNGNFVEKKLAKHLDRNPLVKILTKTDERGIASATGNSFAGRFGLGEGEGALAANVTEAGLRAAGMSGTTSVGRATYLTAKEDLPGFAVEQGVKYGYNEARDPQSDEERQETEERGFTLE